MIRVLIQSASVVERSGKKKAGGGDWHMREQVAWAYYHNIDGEEPFPTKLLLRLEDGAKPYPPGEYRLSPSSVARGDYDSMIVRRVDLLPFVSAK
jgi:hypothetical protein